MVSSGTGNTRRVVSASIGPVVERRVRRSGAAVEQLQLEGNSDEHGEDQPGGDQMDGGLHGGPRLPLEADA